MSDPLRIALVAEGPTDEVVISAALRAMLQDRSFVLTQIFPEGSVSFGELGAGWAGVYRWCHQAAIRGSGKLQKDALVFQFYDLLIIHLDADVAAYRYADNSIEPEKTDAALPCEKPCPPAADSTNALRSVLLSWCGEDCVPERTVLCIPSKSTEAWVIAALLPGDLALKRDIECYPHPEKRLSQQPKAKRFRKNRRDYLNRASDLESGWIRMINEKKVDEACRFQNEFLEALQKL